MLLIHYPPDYEQSDAKYPVLYLLDGYAHFHHGTGIIQFLSRIGRMPQMIVVSLLNTRRGRDFSPETWPGSNSYTGGADNFIQFLEKELFPFMDKNYRTEPYKILAGHSLAGTFTLFTFLTNPEIFDAFISISPCLWWPDRLMLKKAEMFLDKYTSLNKNLHIAHEYTSGEPATSMQEFIAMLKERTPQELEWQCKHMEGEDHSSLVHNSLYEGFKFIYSSWKLPDAAYSRDIETVKKHYENLSKKYGYAVKIPENVLNRLGNTLLRQKSYEKAIKALEYRLTHYSENANTYQGLGEAYSSTGEKEQAVKYLIKSLEMNIENESVVKKLNELNPSWLDEIPETVVQLTENIYRLSFNIGNKTNIGVITGQDGALLIDTGHNQVVGKINRFLNKTGNDNIKYIINTHRHWDHIDGNIVAGEATTVIDFTNLDQMVSQGIISQSQEILKGKTGKIFEKYYTMDFNGEEMRIIPNPGIHSVNDILIHFTRSGVVFMGDLLLSESFPALSNVKEYLKFLEKVMDVFPEDAKFVSGHGRDYSYKEVEGYYKMLVKTVEIIKKNMQAGKSVKEMQKEKVLKKYESFNHLLFWLNTDFWINNVFRSLRN